MMSLFRGASRSPGPAETRRAFSKARPSPNPAIRRTGPSAHAIPSDAEWRLEQELSAILSHRPIRHRHLDHETERSRAYADIEPPEPPPRTVPFVGPHPRPSGRPGLTAEPDETDSLFFVDMDAEEDGWATDPGDDRSTGRARRDPRSANWLRAARRARRNRGLRLIASWFITMVVGGFIVAVAAAILFGMPGGDKFSFRKNAELESPPTAAPEPAKTALSETRWRLD